MQKNIDLSWKNKLTVLQLKGISPIPHFPFSTCTQSVKSVKLVEKDYAVHWKDEVTFAIIYTYVQKTSFMADNKCITKLKVHNQQELQVQKIETATSVR